MCRPVRDLPVVLATVASRSCASALVDPRDGTEVRFGNSVPAYGDYEVPTGRYGVKPGEALRIECNTGKVLAVATR